MNIDLFQIIVLAVYSLTLVVVATYGLHRYHLVYLFHKHKGQQHTPNAGFDALPRVTIQLPMYNEQTVARRIIDAACKLDYPKEKLQIQVLDDSNDGSEEIARQRTQYWKDQGFDIVYQHRTNRLGYKAGALAEGLKSATGNYIAIFDADFIPPQNILHNVLHHFVDNEVGMVQVRWDHINRDASLLTKGQAIFLDGHFVIEHTARNTSGRFMHFNGTAGVWRRECIDAAGGWQHDTLTEDLDLSYRAQLKGWKFVYLPQFVAPAELPPEMVAFKQQAHRWTKGSFQTAIKLLPSILRSPVLPWSIKSEAFFHLTNTVVYPFVVLLTLLMYPAFILAEGPLKHHPFAGWLFGITLFVVASCSASTFFVYAQILLFGKKIGWKTVVYLPYLMALGVGLSINNTRAVFEAIFTRKNGRNEFVRTPKYGVSSTTEQVTSLDQAIAHSAPASSSQSGHSKSFLTLSRLLLPLIEIAFGIYMCVFISIALIYGYALGSIPFLLLFAAGYFYVGFSTIHVLWQMEQARTQPQAQTDEDAVTVGTRD
jgi:cellulose synthase/poly-beta-1,6-N-acetylglucosamine synthase-like glycosyltransferase